MCVCLHTQTHLRTYLCLYYLLVLVTKTYQQCISVIMGPTEIPSQSTETIKIPTAHYEFGANYIDPKVSGCYHSCIKIKLFDFNSTDGFPTVDAHWEGIDRWQTKC